MENDIIEVLKRSDIGMTANAIAKEIGMSKASEKFREKLVKLVDRNILIDDASGKYTTYIYNKDVKIADTIKTEVENVIPEVSKQIINGYEIHKGRDATSIVVPDGSKIKLDKDQFLVVINGKPEYAGVTLEDAFNIIKSYTIENDIRSFVVEDICQSKKIGTKDDIKIPSNNIMFLTIKKHNKAA